MKDAAEAREGRSRELGGIAVGRFIGVVFGYMAIGILITAAVAFLFAFSVVYFGVDETGVLSDAATLTIIIGPIAALILAYIVSFINSIHSVRTGRAPWVGYIIYAILIGIGCSAFLLLGISFETIGEAFLITAASFGAMFLVGYFSKSDLSPLLIIAIGVLIAALFISASWGIIWLIDPARLTFYDMLVSSLLVVYCLLITAVEAHRIGKIAKNGEGNNNLALFCAFTMYADFISILIRIIYILAIARDSK